MSSVELKQAWANLADHTRPHCLNKCRVPKSCCSKEHCETTIEYAKSVHGIDLQVTNHPIPLMGEHGCTVEPYLRPFCTLHVCCIYSMGYDPNDPDWTDKYFDLRDKIEELVDSELEQ